MVCKITHGILRLLNKGGTALPGKIALKICPEVLELTAAAFFGKRAGVGIGFKI